MSRCLTSIGLVRVGIVQAHEWAGVDPARLQPLFVEGPYKKLAMAKRSARSLVGIEAVARGGRYVVSATLAAKVGPAVRSAARCLSTV